MPRFVIQKHHASRLHYDFRLEMDGVLKSWAVPKEPTADTKVRRLAIEVDDHELAYADFEGEIAEGRYGAGKVEIWDRGEYELLERSEGFLRFKLRGRRMLGPWKLVKTHYPPGNNWLLCASTGAQMAEGVESSAAAQPAPAAKSKPRKRTKRAAKRR
jgi:DNA ligase D-like protein (predicted 3'-phosphoesterase)